MKKVIFILLVSFVSLEVSAQFTLKVVIKEPIEGICDQNNILALNSAFKNEKEPICPITQEQILVKLNTQVEFLKINPGYTDQGMVNLIINCKGEVVACLMDNKTKSVELDKQIQTVFKTLGTWQAGAKNDQSVDCSKQIKFKIVEGQFVFI